MLHYYVSIPNGMEFYYISSSEVYGIDSFNSQRDGILQIDRQRKFLQD